MPSAIIEEYFSLLSGEGYQETRTYKIPPIDASTPLPMIRNGNVKVAREKGLQDLRYIFFMRVAEYLSGEDSVFPEDSFFQIVKGKPTSNDGKLIANLRDKFVQFFTQTETRNGFADEIQMIDFFEHTRTR
jgi:hypothetical protein